MKKHEGFNDEQETIEGGAGGLDDVRVSDAGSALVLDAPVGVGVADRPSGVRRIQGGVSKRFGKGKEPLDPLPPGAHWNLTDEGPDDLERAGVSAVGCFYVRLEGFDRWRCFNRLTGFEHVTYHTAESLRAALLDQSAKWQEKLMPTARISPWASGWATGQKAKAS